MNSSRAREGSSSRFHFQQVSASTRQALMVDTGCQRCQHCLLRRLHPLTDVTTTTPIIDQSVPSARPKETRSHVCKK